MDGEDQVMAAAVRAEDAATWDRRGSELWDQTVKRTLLSDSAVTEALAAGSSEVLVHKLLRVGYVYGAYAAMTAALRDSEARGNEFRRLHWPDSPMCRELPPWAKG